MLKMGVAWIGLLPLLIGSALLPVTARGADCEKATTQREIEECSRAEFENLNRALETAYSDYLKPLAGREHDLLERAQESWLRYRDANCEASAAVYAGGSLAATELVACKKRLSQERLAELKRIYEEPPFPASQ
jgi:uncharacterized protein YecT (DUF1311 family)